MQLKRGRESIESAPVSFHSFNLNLEVWTTGTRSRQDNLSWRVKVFHIY